MAGALMVQATSDQREVPPVAWLKLATPQISVVTPLSR
jgi:hypothetical protein